MQNKTKPFVSIVVLNWNGKRFVDPFLNSFINQDYPSDRTELIFTDNGSTDDSVDYFNKKYSKEKNIKLVLNGKNYGYAGGNNRGIKHAKGDYILICNNDLELDKKLVSSLVESAERTRAAVTVPKLMYLNKPGIINNAGSRLDARNDWPIWEIGKDEKDAGQFSSEFEITAFCGACPLITREFLHNVGLFDDKFFLYFEDGDLSWRGQIAGYKYMFTPKAIAYHFHTGSSKEGSPIFNYYVGRNRVLILLKNASFRVIARGIAKTLKDHLFKRLGNIAKASVGKYGKRQSLNEFLASSRMLLGILLLTPYALLKRYKIIKEIRL